MVLGRTPHIVALYRMDWAHVLQNVRR